ncbi:hypothetical protein JCM30471_23230 [Desulfuromonas carbonis]|uniref:hypothetical protein n=1 Tax=Desulfuromonas sp. DDH964 TaxID=1823759 RepID=UPI00078BD200|nr:hypothetical protein [Desulfuromonas sp. DDH964]AMV73903.1 outer membrane channel OmpJ [Desulfuromonas sp. DDH964]
MSKYLKSFLVVLLAVAVATPALAEFKVGGYYRLQGIATNSDDSSVTFNGQGAVDPAAQTFIDQRIRAKIDNKLNDYVTLTVYTEIDSSFGDAGKDGGPGGDRVAVEVKNAYLDFKVPNSIFSVRTGLQGLGGRYQGLILADDWSAINVGMKFSDAVNLALVYSKPSEGAKNVTDDVDLYNAQLDVNAGVAKIGADFIYLNNSSVGAAAAAGAGDSHLLDGTFAGPYQLYILGAKADAKVGEVGINGFLLYAFGSQDGNNGSDLSGLAATVAAKAKVGEFGLGGRVIYLSGDSDKNDNDSEAWIPNLGGNYDFTGENLMIFLTDAYYNNGTGGRLATEAATLDGVGLLGLTAQANANMGPVYAKLGLGYFMANETAAGQDDQMGFEAALRVGTKVAEKVDVSLNGAYAMLGDYWQTAYGRNLTSTPDDIWKTVFMINVGY